MAIETQIAPDFLANRRGGVRGILVDPRAKSQLPVGLCVPKTVTLGPTKDDDARTVPACIAIGCCFV